LCKDLLNLSQELQQLNMNIETADTPKAPEALNKKL
jgi:hypothetical protein